MQKKIIKIPTSLENFYKHYFTVLKPITKLRTREIEVLACILYMNEVEKPNILKQEDRWNKVFSYEGKQAIRSKLELEDYNLNNILSALRKKNVIVNNQVPDRYIPKIEDEIQLIFSFKIDG